MFGPYWIAYAYSEGQNQTAQNVQSDFGSTLSVSLFDIPVRTTVELKKKKNTFLVLTKNVPMIYLSHHRLTLSQTSPGFYVSAVQAF